MLITPEVTRASELAVIDAVCFTDPWSETSFREALGGGGYTFVALEENGSLIPVTDEAVMEALSEIVAEMYKDEFDLEN